MNTTLNRIDRKLKIGKGYHLSIAVNEKGKILSLRIRKKYCGDIKDAKYLYKHLPYKPEIILFDKAYDSEPLHKYFSQLGVRSIIPVRKGAIRGFHRLALKRDSPRKLYNKRNIVESTFFAWKKKFGSSVSAKLICSARTDAYCKAIMHNIFFKIIRLSGLDPFIRRCPK